VISLPEVQFDGVVERDDEKRRKGRRQGALRSDKKRSGKSEGAMTASTMLRCNASFVGTRAAPSNMEWICSLSA